MDTQQNLFSHSLPQASVPVADMEDDESLNPHRSAYILPKDRDLPPVMRELVSNAPANFKMPTFIACQEPLATLATRLRFYYPFDQSPMACLLQTIICSEQSGGKSFARNVESAILSKQKARDNEQRRQEQAYRELKQQRAGKSGKNNEIPEAPKTCIVCCPVSISIAQLIKRADAPVRFYGAPITLHSFSEELSTAVETNKRAFSNIKSIMRTAYDLGSEYGVDYLSDNSYSATVDILYNTMFCTTPSTLDEYMDRKAIEGGNITRTIVCDLGSQLGDDAPIFSRITAKQQTVIDKVVDELMSSTFNADGSIAPEIWLDMRWLWDDVRQWCAAKNLEAVKTGSNALGVFFKRSSVSAYRIAALCFHLYRLDGRPMTKCRKLSRQIYYAMAEEILSGMLSKWGKRYEDLLAKRVELTAETKRDLFGSLPVRFNRDLLRETIKRLELTTPDWVFISKWNAKGLIRKNSKNDFQKL